MMSAIRHGTAGRSRFSASASRVGTIAGAALLAIGVAGAATPDETPSVTVTSFDRVKLFPTYTAPGTTMSLNDSQISAEITGVIQAITVKPGDMVKADDILVRLDCQNHQYNAQAPRARLRAASAERELADFRLERAATLRDRGAMPLEQFQQRKAAAVAAESEVRRLRAVVQESEERVAKCDVRAPFNAVVVQRYASVGELASPGTRLLRLVDRESLEVSSQIQEQDLDTVSDTDGIEFVSRGRHYGLRLRSVVPVLDRRVSSYEVRFEFTDATPAPGQSGRVTWHDGAPHVPAELLVRRGESEGVFLAVEGTARFRALEHAQPGKPAAADLADDEQLIVDGRYGLSDGQAIRLARP